MPKKSQLDPAGVAGAITLLLVKIVAVAAVLFVLLRLISPMLMTQHDDLSFWIGAACWPLGLVLLIWAGVWIGRDTRIIRRRLDDRHRRPKVM